MTLEELADLIRANRANTNGRIDRVVDHVRDLHGYMDMSRKETYATLLSIQTLTDVRGEIKDMRTDGENPRRDVAEVKSNVAEIRQSLALVSTVAAMRREIDRLSVEIAELKQRAS